MRQLSHRLFEVEESERRRLARELHDRVGQNVTALSLNLNMVRSELPADALQKMSPRLNDCESLLYYTAQLVRDIQVDLRPPGLDELGLVAALNEHARQVAGRGSFKVTVIGTELAPRLPPASEITLFRIVQESLNNISKHAQATEVSIALEASLDAVILTVADDGCGFDSAARLVLPTRSLGMVGMRERVESIGGRLRVESAPGEGTRVIVEAPRAAPSST
ncbi:MAG: sensor histidine kinase [Betaproteobacteria bacterium]|nr:sensor histidine kinase [Betaproteobacteria bacterium]